MSRRNPKRSTKAGRFAMLPLKVLATPAVTTLSHAAFRVMALLASQYTGYNNGGLGLTAGQAATSGIRSDNTFYRALRELEEHALIERTYHASRVPPRPTMYALTWISIDDTEYSQKTRLPSHTYREYKPPARKPRRQRTRLRVVT
jgi:chromosome segregation and condensation protein ScpB